MLWASTVPGSCPWVVLGAFVTDQPYWFTRIDWASVYDLPTTLGIGLLVAWLLSRLCVNRYPPTPSSATISAPIRTPSHTRFEDPSGSGGGSTSVGCRAITCVAVASPTIGSNGVASTSMPWRTRSRSAISSPAVWYRLAGFFAMHFITTASRRGGTSGLDADGGGGVSFTCL